MPDVVITPMENGPYLVRGPVTLIDADGTEYDVADRKSIALCRCGGSTTKPFCPFFQFSQLFRREIRIYVVSLVSKIITQLLG